MPEEFDIEVLARETPTVVPVFPLPEIVLLPRQRMPLRLFESRYRAMLAYALTHGRRIAMAALGPGWEDDYHGEPPILSRVGVGAIIEHTALPDGRANIELLGVARADVLEEVRDESEPLPFRLARVRLVSPDAPSTSPTGTAKSVRPTDVPGGMRAAYLKAVAACLPKLRTPLPLEALDLPYVWSVGTIADVLAPSFPFSYAQMQRLLEIDDDEARAEYFLRALQAAAPDGRIDRRYGFPGASAN